MDGSALVLGIFGIKMKDHACMYSKLQEDRYICLAKQNKNYVIQKHTYMDEYMIQFD
jgi:hypothetical protein